LFFIARLLSMSLAKVDYFERAKRLAEIPLLQKQYEEQRVSDHQFHEEQEEERVSKRQISCVQSLLAYVSSSFSDVTG